MNKTKLLTITSCVALYLIVSGASYFGFTALASKSGSGFNANQTSATGKSKIDLSLPKTEACPINGEKYTVSERKLWETRRPITVMIENHEEARPQSGLSRSDVVYEAVAEGGITRFMAVFYCAAQAQDVVIAPVRSSRIYFIKLAQEYGDRPLYVHVGGANAGEGETAIIARALEYLESIGWRTPGGNDIDTTFDSGYPTLWRDYERLNHPVATEHTMTSSTEKIWAEAVKRKLDQVGDSGQAWNKTYVPWKFKDDAATSDRGTTNKISFGFWSGYNAYNVVWNYDPAANQYARTDGGTAQVDHNNNEPLTAKNVIVEFTQQKGPLDVHMHMWYGVEGTGKAIVFTDGKAVTATWTKSLPTGRTVYADAKTGKEIPLVAGRVWVEILPIGTSVTY